MATDTNIEIKQSRYEETRRRLTRFKNGLNISDREIIESLSEEIEYYRNKIKHQDEIIDKLSNKTIESKEELLDTADEEIVDEDIIEIISTTQYANGKPIISKMEYKYKE